MINNKEAVDTSKAMGQNLERQQNTKKDGRESIMDHHTTFTEDNTISESRSFHGERKGFVCAAGRAVVSYLLLLLLLAHHGLQHFADTQRSRAERCPVEDDLRIHNGIEAS